MIEVLWLNKETLKEKYLNKYYGIKGDAWVQVPDGATFATGVKKFFVFRKDGWYYEDGEWIKTELTLDKVYKYSELRLFWVKSEAHDNQLDNCDDKFTLERLLGCEVELFDKHFYMNEENLKEIIRICSRFDKDSEYILSELTFFTEDGDELTFDEYVQLYYPKG